MEIFEISVIKRYETRAHVVKINQNYSKRNERHTDREEGEQRREKASQITE